jgi:hypothetical protein
MGFLYRAILLRKKRHVKAALVFQKLRAINEDLECGCRLHFRHTCNGLKADYPIYGPKGFIAIEVKRLTL